ncbi:MAG: adenylyltransferase/cytidyltransferase family protein [Alphaproteobacteria bacterium]|nr:adenylyltransferase/cytidyltransferase family protein [Alphaproteobacteria bacterium]MDE2110079.1 adenylyltransferase/cytidyltransferase family protein [Alphaproteobacteria bacterium]MDE2495105.1 adenylyltransferase/cytidyltransferase family protein [Alphaproteobacteria bacterium]
MTTTRHVVVAGGFDDIRSHDLRFLEEAARLGPVTVFLSSDETIRDTTGRPPKFPLAERQYFLSALRYVSGVVAGDREMLSLPVGGGVWVERARDANPARRRYCEQHGFTFCVVSDDALAGFPEQISTPTGRKKVVVTGCYDWFHSGHVRFFEEASVYGDLYVGVGNDANIRLLKGEGHPLLPEQERRYVVGSVRYVTQAFVSSGDGWLDAEPDIRRLKPDFYVVNEDGDKGGKIEFCRANGIEYVVLRRTPAPGLPKRSSTDLRGF